MRTQTRYDVIVAGARCAGAATGMLLARAGLRVLVVDPARAGSDTLSTHALMRSATHQLHRWGLLEAVRRSGAPAVRKTTFHYGTRSIEVEIAPRDGVDALYAPRRNVLDGILVNAAERAGADLLFEHALIGLHQDGDGRVRGARIVDRRVGMLDVEAGWVIGADGVRSRVARLTRARTVYEAGHSAATVYGYVPGLPNRGYEWYYVDGAAAGVIPTNEGSCVFVAFSEDHFERERPLGLERLFYRTLRRNSRALAHAVETAGGPDKLRGFAGRNGYLRESAGPGWALVGDAGYFRDPITAHGISDAFREAEILAHTILEDGLRHPAAYQAERDARVRGLSEVTERIAKFDWTLEAVEADHRTLNREMKALAATVRDLPVPGAATRRSA